MLAFVPLLAVILALAVQLLQDSSLPATLRGIDHKAINELESGLHHFFPDEVYVLVQTQIVRMQKAHPVTVLSTGLLLSIWASSTLYMAVLDALHHIYDVVDKRSYWRRRFLAIILTLTESIILLMFLTLMAAWPLILQKLGLHPLAMFAASLAHFVAAFIIVLAAFAVTFRVGPHSVQRTSWITPGSLCGAVIFITITQVFHLYVQNLNTYDAVYGSLGGVIILLLWFWLSSNVLLGAAALNKVLEDRTIERSNH